MLDVKKEYPILNQVINGMPYIYLDSAASVPMSTTVQKAVQSFLNTDYANVHRGVYTNSQRATERYENVRHVVQQFIRAETAETIVFTHGTTDSLNLVARSFGQYFIQKEDEILVSIAEHHANLIPWQELAKRKGAKLIFMPLTEQGTIDIDKVKKLITNKSKIIAVSHVSNVLGYINPINELADLIHQQKGIIVIDGAQSVPHFSIDVTPYDFYAFSGHKLGSLNGVGVLYGKEKWLDVMQPIQFGGDMITKVSETTSSWANAPYKFEAGTPNITGVISLGYAIQQLQQWQMNQVATHVQHLSQRALNQLRHLPDIILYTHQISSSGIMMFNMKNVHPHDVATGLDMEGIAVRAGHHCAQPLMTYLNTHATVRASFYVYNTLEDVDALIASLKKVKEFFSHGII